MMDGMVQQLDMTGETMTHFPFIQIYVFEQIQQKNVRAWNSTTSQNEILKLSSLKFTFAPYSI